VNWTALAAIATWFLVPGTLWAVVSQARANARSRSAEAFLILVDRWDAEVMREKRHRLATALLDGYEAADEEVGGRIEEVIDFFEDLGMFVKEQYLGDRVAWSAFSSVALDYWFACGRRYIEYSRKEDEDPSLYEDYEYLVKLFLKRDKKVRRGPWREPSLDELHDFLQDEAGLGGSLFSKQSGQPI